MANFIKKFAYKLILKIVTHRTHLFWQKSCRRKLDVITCSSLCTTRYIVGVSSAFAHREEPHGMAIVGSIQ